MTSGMPLPEEELDRLIDALNAGRTPPAPSTAEAADHEVLVRALKGLGESSTLDTAPVPAQVGRRTRRSRRRPLFWAAAAAVAAGVLLGVQALVPGLGDRNWVLAMEQAVAQLTSYHGVLEVQTTNAEGEAWLTRRLEIWSDGDRYAVRDQNGVLTVNNGTQRWQVRPEEREVAVLPLIPDPRSFDLHDEADRARGYPHEVEGRETVAGREAVRLRITPPGGQPYHLWLDAESGLPLRLQTAMQNALQTTYTFVTFEANAAVDPDLFELAVPDGFTLIEEDPGQLVTTPEEAEQIAGFAPPLPDEAPARILARDGRIVLDYGDTYIEVEPDDGDFEPEPYGALGRAAGGPLEVLGDELRWVQDGLLIRVAGGESVELARQLAPDLELPDRGDDLISAAQIPVRGLNREALEASQQQVDAGSSPWLLDPVYVAHVFVNLLVSPEGITGEGEIPFEALTLAASSGAQAVVEVSEGPAARVYLARLVRQDETGIWTVVGYDPREGQ
ncbi:MAG TPA: sigma-E factor regulatory protein RseB domain-containing protein [Bacillota bacterium]